MHNHTLRVLNLWGVLHLGIVVAGIVATAGTGAQDPPPARDAVKAQGHADETIRLMRLCYEQLRDNGWENYASALPYAVSPDHDEAELTLPGATSFCFPKDPAYNEVALYCDIYFKSGQHFANGKGVSTPHGYYLVMFKDGTLEQVDGSDVREIPSNTVEDATIPVFPGMDEYDPNLPKLVYYQAPWYRGKKDQEDG